MRSRTSAIPPFIAAVCWILLSLAGCGPEESQSSFSGKLDLVESSPPADSPASAEHASSDTMTLVSESAKRPKLQRRIVYNSQLQLVVTKYEEFEKSIVGLVEKHDGFISSSETDRRYENRQSGTWVARIPVEQYSEFLSAVTALGFPESRTEHAQDITAEYIDVEARMRNNQQLEQRILEMLQERTGKLSDVLEIERELARVRDEIERMQGRIRVLTDQSSLATITIKVREEQEYLPPSAPTLSSQLKTTWGESIESLRRTGAGFLLLLVALIPWIVTLSIVALLGYFVARWIARRFRNPRSS